MPSTCAAPKNDSARFPLRVLLGLLWLTAGSHPVRADPFLNQLQRATPARRVVLVLNYFDTCQTVIQRQPDAFRVLDAVEDLGKKTGDDQLRRYGRYLRATYAKHKHTHAQNAALFLAVGQQAEADDDSQIAAVCRHFAGQYFFLNEEYGKAFEHLLAANNEFQAIGYERVPGVSRYLYELAFNYYYFFEYEKAIGLLNQAVRYPPFNANLAIQTHNTLGLAYNQLGQTKNPALLGKAEQSFVDARRVAASVGDSLWMGIASSNLVQIYLHQQKAPQALAALREGYRTGMKFGKNQLWPYRTALNLADVYLRLDRRDSCAFFLGQSLRFYRLGQTSAAFGSALNQEEYLKEYYDVARRYHRAVGNLPKAYACADSLLLLTNRINKRYNAERISLVNQKLLIQRHQSEVEAIGREKATQRTRFIVVGLGLVLVAGLFFRLYQLARLRRRQEAALNAEREKSLRLEKQLVEEELGRAQADLSLFMDHLRQKNALIDAISAELEGLAQTRNANHETPQPVREAQQSLEVSSLLTNDDWAEFQRRFERVHPGFFAQLKSQFTDLSPAEERLMSLAKLRVNSRQMGRMLGISPESIRKTRYRLRKKLGIGGHSSLAELLGEWPDDPANA